jgi:hypothetical protein
MQNLYFREGNDDFYILFLGMEYEPFYQLDYLIISLFLKIRRKDVSY